MSKWILICPKCKTEFEHSQISDVGMSFLMIPTKPEFAPNGNDCVCPNCGYSATYLRTELLYRT
jgi:predicted nucleic-acid-binding Zn-ribbon protein